MMKRISTTAVALTLAVCFVGRTSAEQNPLDTLPDDYQPHTAAGFVLWTNAGHETAQRQLRQLAAAEATFFAEFASMGAVRDETDPPLVCIFFDEAAHFDQYARRADRRDMSWTSGYYSTRTNRLSLLVTPPTLNDVHFAETEQNDHQQRTRLRIYHELTHQLAFNSGLQKRGVMYPLWIAEGLATSMEKHAGATEAADRWRTALQQARMDGSMEPLAEFVQRVRAPARDLDRLETAYAQSWGLYRFLHETQPRALAEHLRRLAELPTGPRPAAQLREEFQTSFGDIDVLERQWRSWIDDLPAEQPKGDLLVASAMNPGDSEQPAD